MAQILHYFVCRTTVDGLPNADSKSISESAMNLSQGGHIQKIMVNTAELQWMAYPMQIQNLLVSRP